MKRIGRTIPPATSPIYPKDIINGLKGLIRGQAEVERFRTELKSYFKVKHVFLVSSGKAALTLILRALHKLDPDRNEVIIPAFCCYSVPSAIVRADLKVKLCDVDPDTLDYNYSELEKIIAEYQLNKPDNLNNPREASHTQHAKNNTHTDHKLLAVIPLHLFGIAADVERVRSLVNDPSVNIIEDAAQVMGSTWQDKKLGILGDVAFFSLGRGKTITAVEGGIILTNRDDIAAAIRKIVKTLPGYSPAASIGLLLKAAVLMIFQNPSLFWFPRMLPFLKMGDTIYDPNFAIRVLSGFQAGLLRNWEKKIELFNRHRRKAAGLWYRRLNTGSAFQYGFSANGTPNFLRYPIRVKNEVSWEKILRLSEKKGLGIMLTYPNAVNKIPALERQFRNTRYPSAGKLVKRILTLPVHPLLSETDKTKIERTIRSL